MMVKSKFFYSFIDWKVILLSPMVLGAMAVSAIAAPKQISALPAPDLTNHTVADPGIVVAAQVAADEDEDTAIDQVTSVSQLTDVKPTDWAFQALQSLVERYGCIVGYPDKTYRGNRALTRYEFAAGLNACLDKIQELIAAATADFVKKEDLETVKRLQEEFAAELGTLRGRVAGLEVRTATLEKQQFSTTTKLNGEVIFAGTSLIAGDDINGNELDQVPIFVNRTRLNFDTTFTGEDLLRVRLQAFSFNSLSNQTGYPEGELRFSPGFEGQQNGAVSIDALLYQFPLGEKTTITLEANAGAIDDFTNTVNPFLDGDGGSGALSQFGTRNSIYYLVNGTGIGLRHEFSDKLELSLGYLANDAANPNSGSGLFDGPYGAIAQLTFKPFERLTLGVTYINAYNTDFTANGATGSLNANLRTATGEDVSTNSYGAQFSFQLTDGVVLNGWAGYTAARVLRIGDGKIWNWGLGVAFPDLGKPGNLGGILIGMEPKLTSLDNSVTAATGITRDRNTSLHIEAFYQYRINDNIAITPGLIWLTAPNHNNNNSDTIIGTVRTTFTF
jgi:Carbohydrate-selective porin, OprB family/S-layer homology domain